ncbi:MAG: pyruvate kinase [Proteobacteria bacterium]|nr:pyruvate kinase [Candidatus Enterousia scatequi]
MYKFTKITASIGPQSETPDVLMGLIHSGANAVRLNFSHDTGDVQGDKIDSVRKISSELNMPVAIIIDLQGPKHRIGDFETDGHYKLVVGQKFTFDNDRRPGNSRRVCLPHDDVLQSLHIGDRVLLNDGKIEMRVSDVKPGAVTTTVVRGNEIWSRRGFNLPDTLIDTPVLTPKDIQDLEYAITKDPDFVAVSFVQRASDIESVRDFITARTSKPIKIIAKIERPQALDDLHDIIAASDAVMVARGDLAIEIPFEQVPSISRKIIRMCRSMNRPVIMATQMLASMVESEFPTRAEISDVATSAYLRVDSTMTSEETTVGINPILAIETMSKILSFADMDTIANPYDWSDIDCGADNDWSRSVVSMVRLNKSPAIVVFDMDGNTSVEIACRRPDVPIISVCGSEIVANQLCLSRGVIPIYNPELFGMRDAFGAAHACGINFGDIVIVDDRKISLRTLV